MDYKINEMTNSDWDEWNNSHITSCRLVVLSGDVVFGWFALILTSSRLE